MQEKIASIVPLLAPAVLLIFSFIILISRNKDFAKRDQILQYLSVFGLLVSLVSAITVFQYGTLQSGLIGWEGLGLALRLDPLSITMLTMISLLGLIVLRFSKNYLAGDPRKWVFMIRLATTIASVELLVLSGNLGQLFIFWVITSVCLHYLLVFYRSRPQAIAAARKKFVVARLGDVSLFAATLLIYNALGTGNLEEIFAAIQNMGTLTTPLIWATVLLVFTAILKSAQFPTHGWLIEVVETPTPVSALLHAGLLNAGPFLMVRMGFLMVESTPASLMLIIIGGFTALFASVVFLTQPSVKVALGYSSIAHMGFSLLICGFGVHTAAILHVVAHSFYKAHAFLSSGSVVDIVRSRKMTVPSRVGSLGRITLSILSALGIYVLFCYMWGVKPEEDFNLMATGAIIVLGLSQVIVSTVDSKGSLSAVVQSGVIAFIVALSFFSLEHGAHLLLASQLPVSATPSMAIKWAASTLIAIYAITVFIQLISPRLKPGDFGYRLGVHLRNGLYVNVIFDRIIGSLKHEKFKWANLEVKEGKAEWEDSPAYQAEPKTSEQYINN
ncbi:MAG: proton-conducting transporter membrane subunit [Bacteroidota bacterium]